MNVDSVAKTALLIAFWLVCLAVVGAALSTGVPAGPSLRAWHDVLYQGFIVTLPYLVVAPLPWFFRNRSGAVLGLLLVVGLFGLLGTLTRSMMLQEHLRDVAAEAAGKRGMSCGPPVWLFWVGLEWLGMIGCLIYALVFAILCLVNPDRNSDTFEDASTTWSARDRWESGEDEHSIQRLDGEP